MIHYICPVCKSHVAIRILDYPDGPMTISRVQAWCHGEGGKHRETRMEVVPAPEPAHLTSPNT